MAPPGCRVTAGTAAFAPGFAPTPPTRLPLCHPVNLAQPDRAVTRGQPSIHTGASLAGLCPRVAVW